MNCIYGTNFRIPPMETTGSTGAYGGLVETPETATLLAKKEPEVKDGVSSCDTPDGRASRHSSPRRDLFPSKSHHARCQPDEHYCLLVTIQFTTVIGRYFSRSAHACRSIDRQNHPTLFESGNYGHHTSCNLEQHRLCRLPRMTIQG